MSHENEIVTKSLERSSAVAPMPLPVPRCEISIRVATLADVPFMDRLQKMHGKALGYFPTKQFEGYVQSGGVLIAHEGAQPIGYCISRDRYLKRDELGVIYQLCVEPGAQRKLVGAMLVREVFARSAYGCKLYCCWCAQDLEANYFWESMGFIPIAFRAGSSGKRRVHIFWQRRIVEGDTTTPLWFPSQTNSGAIREDRLVLPIPPGTHWRDVMPVVLPRESPGPAGAGSPKVLSAEKKSRSSNRKTQDSGLSTQHSTPRRGRAVQFGRPPATVAQAETVVVAVGRTGGAKREKKPKLKNDPRHVAAARELRDRYLEQFNSGLVLTGGQAKYDVSRQIQANPPQATQTPLLTAA